MKNNSFKTTYHRDNTITYWSVYEQVWKRVSIFFIVNNHDDFASLSDIERKRINNMINKALKA